MTKNTISKFYLFLKSFFLRPYKKKIYIRNLEQDFINQRIENESLKKQLRLLQF